MAIKSNERRYQDGVQADPQAPETQNVETNTQDVETGAEASNEEVVAPEETNQVETSGFDEMSNYFDEESGYSSAEFDDISIESKAITDAQLAEAEAYDIPENAFLRVDADADKAFEEAQGFTSQLTRAVAGGLYKGTMTFIQNVGYIADVPQWFGFSNSFEEGYTNMLSEWAGERKEKYDEYNAIYGDSVMAKTMRGLQGLVDSTVGFAGIGGGAGSLVKGGVGLIGSLVKMGKLSQKLITQLGTAAVTNYAESVMMGAEMHKEIMDKAMANDISYDEAVKTADSEVRDFIMMNKVNVFSDAIALKGILKGHGTIRGGMDRSFKQKALDQMKQGFGESFEEMSAGFFQKDETRDALIELGLEQKDNSSYLGRATQYATSEEGLTEGFMGFIGGPFQHLTVKAFSSGITKAREKLGLVDPVKDPGEFAEERPDKSKIIRNVSAPMGPMPLDPVESYMKANPGVSKEDASKAVSKEDWDTYRQQEREYNATNVTEEDYQASKKEYDKQVEDWKKKKAEHDLKKQEYVNYIENRRLGSNLKAKEDLDKFFKEEGDLMMAYKEAVLDEDGTAMEDIENQRFEGLFARYANRGMIEGLENHLKEVEAGAEGYSAEDQAKATKFLKKIEGYSSDYMKLYNKHGRSKANDLFKLKSRIDGLGETMTAIDKDLDVDRNNIIKEVKSISGKEVSPLQLELMATKAEMMALNSMKLKLTKNPELKIGLKEQLEAKEKEIEKKLGKLEEEVKVKKGDGSESFEKYISDYEIESLDSYKKFVETAGKKMNAWVGYQGLQKTFEFENSAKSKKLLREKYYEHLTDEIENKTFNERDVYTNLAMIGKVELSKKQRQDLIDKLNVANKEITDEMLETKDQVLRAEKRINSIKRMKKIINQKSAKAWEEWKESNEYDFKKEKDKSEVSRNDYNKAKEELDSFERQKKIGKYKYKDGSLAKPNKEGLTLQEKQQINQPLKYSPFEYKRLQEAEAKAYEQYKKDKEALASAIAENAYQKTVRRQRIDQVEGMQERASKRYDAAVDALKAIDIHESADGFKYRVDRYIESLVNGDVEGLDFEEEGESTETPTETPSGPTGPTSGEGGGDGALVVGPTGTPPVTTPPGPATGAFPENVPLPGEGNPGEPPANLRLTPSEVVDEVNENGLNASSLENEIERLANIAGTKLEPKDPQQDGPKEVPDGIKVADLSGTSDYSEAGSETPTGKTNTTSDEMKAVTEVITENFDESGRTASEVATAASAQAIAAGKKNKDVAVTDVREPELNPPIKDSHNKKQKGLNDQYGWSLAYVSSSDGYGDLDDSGLSDWLESEITDKRGTTFRFEVAKADGKAKWATKGDGKAAKAVDKFFNDPKSLTEEDMDNLPIRMVAYDRNGNKIKTLDKEVYGRFKLPFNLNVDGQNDQVSAARKDIVKALLNGENYETKIESVSTGMLKSTPGKRENPSEYIDSKANGEGKLLVSDGVELVYDTVDNVSDEELENSGRDSVGGLAGFVFMKTRSLDGKPFPLKLNSRKLQNKEIQAIMEILSAYAGDAKPSAMFNGNSEISGLRNSDVLDILIYSGKGSLDTEYPFWVDLKGKDSTITFGKDKKRIPLSDLQDENVQKEIAESLALMWRTTNAKWLNKEIKQTDIGNNTFTWFGEEISVDTNYNDFQFAQKALSTNADFPSNRLFVNPTVIMSRPSDWKKIGGKKETSAGPTSTGKEEITREDIHEFYDYDDVLAGVKAISDPSVKGEPVLAEYFYNKTWLGLDALKIKANNYTINNGGRVYLKEKVFPNNEEAKQLVEEIRSTLKKTGDETIISTLQAIATNFGTKDMPAKRLEAGKKLIEILLKNGEDSFFKTTTGFKKPETKRTALETDEQRKLREKEEEVSASNNKVKPADLNQTSDAEQTLVAELTNLNDMFQKLLPKNNMITVTRGGKGNTFNVKNRGKSKSFYTAAEAILYVNELFPKVKKEIEDAGDQIALEEETPVTYVETKVKPLTDGQYLNKLAESFGPKFDIKVKKGGKGIWYVSINGNQTTFRGPTAAKDAIGFVIANRERFKIKGKLPSRNPSKSKTKSASKPAYTDKNSTEVFYITNPNAPVEQQKKSRYFIQGNKILNYKGEEVYKKVDGKPNRVRNKIFANYQIKKGNAVVVEDSYVDKNGTERKFKYVVNKEGKIMSMAETTAGTILSDDFVRTKQILDLADVAFAQKEEATKEKPAVKETVKKHESTPGPNEFRETDTKVKEPVYSKNSGVEPTVKRPEPKEVPTRVPGEPPANLKTVSFGSNKTESDVDNEKQMWNTFVDTGKIPQSKVEEIATKIMKGDNLTVEELSMREAYAKPIEEILLKGSAQKTETNPKVANDTDTTTSKQNANPPTEDGKKVRKRRKDVTYSKKEEGIKDNADDGHGTNKKSDTEKAEQLVRQMISGKMFTDFTAQEQTLIDGVSIERKKEIEKEIKNNPKNSIYSKRKTEADIAKELENIQKILPNVPVEVAKTLIEGVYGGLAEGQFYQGVVTIANGANEGIAYHEGFHAVMDGYLTLTERNNLLKKVQKKYRVNAAQAEEILAEEFREYMLSKREMKVPKSVKWLYDLIMDLVDAFRTNKGKIFSKIRRGRFDYIPPFQHSKRILNSRLKGGLKQELIHEAVDHITYQVIKMAGIRNMDLSVQEGFTDLDEIFEVIRKDIVNEINMAYDEAEITEKWDTFDQLELLHSDEKDLDNWPALVELAKDELKSFSLLETEAIKEDTPMGETNEDEVSGDLNIRPALTYSGKDNATHNTRFMVKMLAEPNQTSKNFGGKFQKLANFSVSWRMLEDSLANIVEDSNGEQIDKMLSKIKDLSETHPEFKELISQLEAPNDVVPLYKKIQFYRAFSKQKITYNHTGVDIEGDEYNYRIGNADQQSHARNLRAQFVENFNNKFIDNGDFKSDSATELSARKQIQDVINVFKNIVRDFTDQDKLREIESQDKFDYSYYITISDALNTLGIEVSAESLQSYVMGKQVVQEVEPGVREKVTNAKEAIKFKKAFLNKLIYPILNAGEIPAVKDTAGKVIKKSVKYARKNTAMTLEQMISKDYDLEAEDNKHFIADNSIFFKLAELEGYRQKETLENMVLGPEGNLYWTKSLNNFISKSVNQWKQDPSSLAKIFNSGKYHESSKWIKYLLGDEYDFKSPEPQELTPQSKQRLENFAVQVYLSNRVENDSTDSGTAFKNMTSVDMHLDSMNKVLNGVRTENGSVFSPLTLADKSSHFMFTGLPMSKYRVGQEGDIITTTTKQNGEVDFAKPVEDMYQYFLAEVDRYSNAQNNKSGNKWFDEKGSKQFFWFPELSPNTTLANEIGLFQKDGTIDITDAKTVEKVKYHIKETLEAQHEKAVQALKQNNIIREDEDGNRTIIGMDSTILSYYQAENVNETNAVNNIVLDYMVNSMTANIEFTMLFTGDPAFYKDLSKRTPATSGQGTDLIFTKDENGNYNTPKEYKILTIKDADTARSEQYKDYRKHLENETIVREEVNKKGELVQKEVRRYTSEQVDAILKPYTENQLNKADGQGFISPKRYKELMIGLGKWETGYDEAFERLMDKDGNPDPRDLLAMQPLKGMHFEMRNENGFAIPTYLKYSQAVLWPALVKGTEHEALLEKMMDPDNPIDEVIYESGVKSGTGTVYNKADIISGKVKPKTTTLSNYSWKLQQDLPTKYEKKGEALVGSQPRKNIFQNMFEKNAEGGYKRSYRVKGFKKPLGPREMAKRINQLESKLSKIGRQKFDNKYGVKNGRITNQEVVYEHLIEKFKRDKVDMNVIEQLEARVPLSLIFQHSDKIEQEIFAELKKATIKLTSTGGSFVQIAGEGFAQVRSYTDSVFNKNGIRHLVKKENGSLKGPRIREDGSLSAQVYLPFKDVENIPGWETMKDEELKEALGDTIKNIVGYRIPNQKISGMDSLEIVGILPASAGDSIVVYDEITGKTGSDFDIDKMYVMMYNTVFNPKAGTSGRLERVTDKNSKLAINPKTKKPYGALDRKRMSLENERLELWAAVLESKDTFTDAILPVDTAWLKNEAYYLHLLDYVAQDNKSKDGVEGVLQETLGYKKNTEEFISWFKKSEFSKEAFFLLDEKGEDVDAETAFQFFMAMPKDMRDEAAAEFFKERPGNSLEFASPFTQNEIRERNLGGKAGVGITANHLTHHNLLQSVGMANVFSADGQSIAETLSAYMNAYVDNAKDPFISLINNNLNTANTVFYMLKHGEEGVGMAASTVNRLLSLPEIRDYVKNIDSQNSKLVEKERRGHLKILGAGSNGQLKAAPAFGGVVNPWSKTFENFSHLNKMNVKELEKLTAKSPDQFTERELEQMMIEGKSDPGLLLFFMQMEDAGRKFNKMVTASKYDTNGPGSGIAQFVATTNLEQEVLEGPFEQEYLSILDETFVGAMKQHSFDDVQTLMSNLFSTAKKPMIQLVNFVNNQIGLNSNYQVYNGTDVDFNKKILKAYQSYAFSNGLNMSPENTKSLFFGDRSMAKRLLKLRSTEKYASNSFLQSLGTKVNPKQGADFVTFPSSKKKDGREKDPLWLEWEELYENEETKQFATDLIKYAYAASGFQKNINSFYDLIPNTILQKSMEEGLLPFNAVMQNTFAESVNFDNFFDQFIAHNPDLLPTDNLNNKALKGIVDKDGKANKYKAGFSVESKKLPYSFFAHEGDGILRKFIVLTPKGKWTDKDPDTGYEHTTNKLLYKLIGEKGGRQYYKRVPTLGMSEKGNHITEYAYDEQIEKSIVSPFENSLSPGFENSITNQSPLIGHIHNSDAPIFRDGNEPILEEVTEEVEEIEEVETGVNVDPTLPITKIISGGQTGADRIGLEVAKELGIETGGQAPKGYRTEKGPDSSLEDFGLTESTSSDYTERTAENVRNSDATVMYGNMSSPGSKTALKTINLLNKPVIQNPTPQQLKQFLKDNNVKVLNVAGNRSSKLTSAKQEQIKNDLINALKPDAGMIQMKGEQTPLETTMSKLDGLQEISKESSLATIETKAGEESVYKLRGQILERQSNYVSRKLEKEVEAKPAMKAGASVGNFVDNVGRDIFDGAKVKTLEEYVKEADEQNKENGFKLNNVTQKEFDLLVDHLTAIKNSLPNMKFVSKELFLNANFTAEQKALLKKDGIGGTLDLLGVDSDGKLHIIDFKNKIFNPDKQQFWDSNLYNDGKFESKLTGWSRQLSIYKEMLEQKGFEVATTSILLVPTEYSYDTEGNIEFGKFHSPNSVGKPIPMDHQSNLSSELINVPQDQEMVEQFRKDTVADIAEAKVGETKTIKEFNVGEQVVDKNGNVWEVISLEEWKQETRIPNQTSGVKARFIDNRNPNAQKRKNALNPDSTTYIKPFSVNTMPENMMVSSLQTEKTKPKQEDLPKPPSVEEIQNEDESVVQVFRISQVKGFRVEVRKEIVDGETVYQAYAVEDVLMENVEEEIAKEIKGGKSILAEPASTQEEAVALAKSKISRFDVQGLLLSLNNACK